MSRGSTRGRVVLKDAGAKTAAVPKEVASAPTRPIKKATAASKGPTKAVKKAEKPLATPAVEIPGKKVTAPEEPSGTTTSKKRARTDEIDVPSKPTKKTKSDATINHPPTEKLDVYVFGSGEYGELGLGYMKYDGKKPKDVRRPRINHLLDAKTVGVVQIAAGGMHCMALTHDNKLLTWGVNDNGALGRDTKIISSVSKGDSEDSDDEDDTGLNPKESIPTVISSELFPEDTKFAQVVVCDSASFVLTTTGKVYGWGTFRGADGIFGFSREGTLAAEAKNKKENKTSYKDVQIAPLLIPELSQIKFLAAGGNHVQALDHKGNVFIWGTEEQSRLGRRIVAGRRANALTPSQLGLPKRKIKDIACGSYHSFAIDNQDRVYSWGLNNFGQTGISNGAGEANAVIESPTIVKSLLPYKVEMIQGGNQHSIACTDNGKVLVWGRCDDSQCGIPTDELPQSALIFNAQGKPRILSEPTVVPDLPAVFVAAGIDNCIAINKKGQAEAWGFSSDYRTGLGTMDTIEEPTRLENSALVGKKITFAACGGQFSVVAGPAPVVINASSLFGLG